MKAIKALLIILTGITGNTAFAAIINVDASGYSSDTDFWGISFDNNSDTYGSVKSLTISMYECCAPYLLESPIIGEATGITSNDIQASFYFVQPEDGISWDLILNFTENSFTEGDLFRFTAPLSNNWAGGDIGGVIPGFVRVEMYSGSRDQGYFSSSSADQSIVTLEPPISEVPVPPSIILFGSALIGLFHFVKRKEA